MSFRPLAGVRAFVLLIVASFASGEASAVDIPPAGQCPPQQVRTAPGQESADEDAVPPTFRPGQELKIDQLPVLRDYLPPEVWERRDTFFYEGMILQIGPCYRRYDAPPFFVEASQANAKQTRLDDKGNLIGYSGAGLPFAQIDDADPAAGQKWAWNYRYRYQGAGFRGRFRLLEIMRRGRKLERYEGRFFMLPLHGVPGVESTEERNRFVTGGEFYEPAIARGLSWRQFRRASADQDFAETDDVFVYVPAGRKVRRAPPQLIEGIYMPSYTRANTLDASQMNLPDGTVISDVTGAATEPVRRGFVGLMIRPNAYEFTLEGVQDVIAPINSIKAGYPVDKERSYGPSGQSVATDTWDVRRAVILRGERKDVLGNVASMTLYADAQSLAPLYMITRRSRGRVLEVGIFVHTFSGEDPYASSWAGSTPAFGSLLSVAETFTVAGSGGWLRESFELASDPPSSDESRKFQTTKRLQLEGR